MATLVYLAAGVALLALIYFGVSKLALAYSRFRGKRVVTCPETATPAAVEVDAKRAALTGVLAEPRLVLKSCSRWPERRECGQECLLQIELAPDDCLIRSIVDNAYEGKSCVFCGKPFQPPHWLDHWPALLAADGVTFEIREVAPERLPEVLATHAPVCWDCHVAETFRRQAPELFIDRPSMLGSKADFGRQNR
jgi:hypothetical protein